MLGAFLRGWELGADDDNDVGRWACDHRKQTTIYTDADWVLPKSEPTGMQCFNNCKALQGGAGTTFDTNRTAYSYMVIDTPDVQGCLKVKQ